MNLLHLKYAVEVEKTGSINKAAENLYMNQPNLSRAIKELENSIGITIFERSARGMSITAEGEEFLRYAKKILSEVDEIESIKKKPSMRTQRFSISVPRASYISDAFSAFSNKIDSRYPAEIFYKETNSLRAINNILHADYKLGIIRYASGFDKYFKDLLSEKGLACELITEFNYKLVMSKKHKLAQKSSIKIEDLTDFIEIAHADPYVPSLPFAQVKREELPDNIKRRIFVYERASQFEILSKNTDTFMWVSPLPAQILERFDLVQKTCEENKKVYKDMLIYRNDYVLTKLDSDFITELCRAKREFID